MPFASSLHTEHLPDHPGWRKLDAPLIYRERLRVRGATVHETFVVPRGFVTDLASIPRLLWVVLPPIGENERAAVLHDWLYTTGKVSRARADAIFRRAMAEDGVGFFTRWTMWAGVRLGGWAHWKRRRGPARKNRSS